MSWNAVAKQTFPEVVPLAEGCRRLLFVIPGCANGSARSAALIDCVKLKPSQSVSVVTGHPMPLFPLEEVPQSL